MMRLYGLILFTSLFASCTERRFDTVITNVAVYDGSENAAVMGDVGIIADTISAVGDLSNATAAVTVDGTGLALAPGFIDSHSHHDRGLSSAPDALAAVSQGITTIIVGQDGGSEVPITKYFQHLADSPVAVNIGSYSGHNSIRSQVLGNDFKRKATQEEVARMITMLKADMEEGALGLSSGLEYDPGIYSSKEEVLALSKVLKPYGGRYISHLRSEDRYFWDALHEIITIGKEAAIPVQISHFKLAMRSLWGKADSTLNILDRARKDGINITADLYPYTYWSSTIRVLFPDRNFKDEKEADFILREVTTPEGIVFSNYQPNPE
ncbi:MAG TPA: amidohydrolase family protein, partial [Chryseolinea sp.]|nr:amidohydrolase family protein [Chryseolinea sp.]